MINPLKRGSASFRAQPDYVRRGSFKPGHEKRGGRKRGTPNLLTADYKKSILEAAYRVGQDGNGKNGICGYFLWVGERHETIFWTILFVSLLPYDNDELYTLKEPRQTMEELNRWFRDCIGLGKNRTKRQPVQGKSDSASDWTGQPFPVGGLMKLAVENPKVFCTMVVAAFLPHPTKRRRPAGGGSRPSAGAA
jgi:hypothetical protein